MRTMAQFYAILAQSVVVLLLSGSTLMPPSHASIGKIWSPISPGQPPTSTSLLNNVSLTPGWWNGDKCDSTHYDNDPANPNHLQAAPLDSGAAYRGEVACGPMPLTSKVDVPVTFPGATASEYEWECTELVKRYLYQAFGTPDDVAAYGYQVVDNFQNDLLMKHQNNGTPYVYPMIGDVLSFAETSPGEHGHTAIVTGADIKDPRHGSGTITILEQNNTIDPLGTGTLQIGPPRNLPWVVGTEPGLGAVTGWLHPNTQVAAVQPGTLNNILAAVSADAANDVWAVGYSQNTTGTTYDLPLIEHWDGKHWNNVSPGSVLGVGNYSLLGVKVFPPQVVGGLPDVWAVGYYTDASGNGQTVLEHSTDGGQTWQETTEGAGFLYAIDGTSANDIWAAGTTPNEFALTLHYTNNWTIILNPTSLGTQLLGVSARTPTDVWAVGTGPSGKAFTMHWNGTWTIETAPSPGPTSNAIWGVTAVAANDVWAVGRSDSAPDNAGFVIHWNGSAWSSTPIQFKDGTDLFGIAALSSTNIWAVGSYFDTTNNTITALIEHTSDGGVTWQQVAPANIQSINQFAGIAINPQNGNVWAVGRIYRTNTTPQTLALTEFFN